MSLIKKTFQYGKHTVSMETGVIARQADASVLIDMDGTVLLVAVVGIDSPDAEQRAFFPLTVNYNERTYAAGKIPGGYFKREGRPAEKAVLISRLIDRPIRPLFPAGFKNEVQVEVTLMSYNPEVPSDIPAMIGVSAALALSGIPFNGPIAGARVGYVNGDYVLNPSLADLEASALDLVVAGTKNAVLMVESEAEELTEEQMLGAVMYGHEQMQVAINAINEMVTEGGNARWDWEAPVADTALEEKVKAFVAEDLAAAYQVPEKMERRSQIDELCDKVIDGLCEGEDALSAGAVEKAFSKLEKKLVRDRVLSGERRIDGRDNTTVRPITVQTGILPRTHGSALFTRGETQALVVTTLGTGRDAQILDNLETGESKDKFMLHYNFPPYCVGETGFSGSPKRREIGHGRLARRSLEAVLPGEDFPYVIRVVSEITESNGSSSMASVCGGSLSLMDAGVPIKAPVAGIAMGLIKEGDKYCILSDILGDEDHLGDMDFKVAGTSNGVTALQMDIKIEGITKDIMQQALAQAKDARVHILGVMNAAIQTPRTDISDFAPRIMTIQIDKEKIREVIGKGGATIRGLIEETGASIDINDDGLVSISSVDLAAAEDAKKRIEQLTAEAEVGRTYEGKVTKIVDFGAFVNILPGKDGLVHISQITEERVEDVNQFLNEGQMVNVKVLEVDRQGRIRLTMKEIAQSEQA